MVNEGNFNNINLCKKNFIWVDDNLITKCYKCLCDFSIINRKHHCRICGKIFCAECTKYYILSPFLNSENILDIDTYLDYLTKYTDKKTEYHRACLACKNNYNYIEKYKDKIKSLESLKISILDYKNLMNVNEEWYMSVKIFLNRISHIQYYLPNTTYKKFESNFLIRNIKYLIGHNKWIVHLIKSQNWEHMKPKRKNAIINGK